MEPNFCSHVLTEVWEALERVRPAADDLSLTDRGFVTAASTDGSAIRVLLRLPATVWREHGRRRLVRDVEDAVREVPAVRDVRSGIKIYQPTLTPGLPAVPAHVPPLHARSSVTGPSRDGHGACVDRVLSGMRDKGWQIEGFQQLRDTTTSREAVGETDIVRVMIHARVDPTLSTPQVVNSPLETA